MDESSNPLPSSNPAPPPAPSSIEDRFLDFLVALVVRVRNMSGRIHRFIPRLITILAMPISVAQIYLRANCNYLAAAIAFQVTLCLIPYLLLAAAIMGYMVSGNVDVTNYLMKYVHLNFQPLEASLKSVIEGIAKVKEQLGIIGLLGLLWTSRGLVFSIAFALDSIHGTVREKPLWRRWVDTTLVVCLATLLITASVVFSVGLTWVSQKSGVHVDEGYSLNAVSFPFSVIVSAIIFLAFYQILPQVRSSWLHSMIGALAGAFLWEFSKYLMIVYFAVESEKYQQIYGTLAVMVYVILWGYMFATGVLVGACTARRLDQEKRRSTYVAE